MDGYMDMLHHESEGRYDGSFAQAHWLCCFNLPAVILCEQLYRADSYCQSQLSLAAVPSSASPCWRCDSFAACPHS